MDVPLIARNLTVQFTAPNGVLLPALGPVTFGIDAGSFVSLVGPSGSGKSTLIRVLAGLQPPTEGVALLHGEPITEPTRRVGLMFQDANLMPWRTVIENIALPLELAGVSAAEREGQAHGLLPMLGLEEFGGVYPGALSGGMAQRVALGRVLAQQPDIMLLDEPFGALDAFTREAIGLQLLDLWMKNKLTALMVTHSINEAVLLSDRILVMSRRPGTIIADIAIDLPRPRTLDTQYASTFGTIAHQVREALNNA